MGNRSYPDLKRISALVAESEWLAADDRWTEEEFLRIWQAAWQASAGQRDALEPLLAAADPAWRERLLQARPSG